jgi:hypothetical protein
MSQFITIETIRHLPTDVENYYCFLCMGDDVTTSTKVRKIKLLQEIKSIDFKVWRYQIKNNVLQKRLTIIKEKITELTKQKNKMQSTVDYNDYKIYVANNGKTDGVTTRKPIHTYDRVTEIYKTVECDVFTCINCNDDCSEHDPHNWRYRERRGCEYCDLMICGYSRCGKVCWVCKYELANGIAIVEPEPEPEPKPVKKKGIVVVKGRKKKE